MWRQVWKDEKGVAMTEAVIVLPVFVVLWMGFVTVFEMGSARLEAQVASLGVALSRSRSAVCDDSSGEQLSGTNGAAAGAESRMGPAEDVLSTAGIAPFVPQHVAAMETVSPGPLPLGEEDAAFHGHNRVMCNMKPRDGLADLVVDFVRSLF